MGTKFKTDIELSESEAPSPPEGKNLKLYADVNDKLGIALTDGTTKKILDDYDLPLPVTRGGTGLNTIGSVGQILSVNEDGDGLKWSDGSSGGGMVNPMTSKGDIITGDEDGLPKQLPMGTNGQVLSCAQVVDYDATTNSANKGVNYIAYDADSGMWFGYEMDKLYYSRDGKTFSQRAVSAGTWCTNIKYINDKVYVFGQTSSYAKYGDLYAADTFQTWSHPEAFTYVTDVTRTKSNGVLWTGCPVETATGPIVCLDDGTSKTVYQLSGVDRIKSQEYRIFFVNDQYVLWSPNGYLMYSTSLDPATWSVSEKISSNLKARTLLYIDGVYSIWGYNDVYYSTDLGSGWTSAANTLGARPTNAAGYMNRRYYFIGTDGYLYNTLSLDTKATKSLNKINASGSYITSIGYSPSRVIYANSIAGRIQYFDGTTAPCWSDGRTIVVEYESQGDDYFYYRVWSDGWIEQGGRVIGSESATEEEINIRFPIAFSSSYYSGTCCGIPSSYTTPFKSLVFAGKSTSYGKAFISYRSSTGTMAPRTINWYACGF